MVVLLVAILIAFPGERRFSTLDFAKGTRFSDTTTPLEQLVTPARQPCSRRFGGWKVKALIPTMLFSTLVAGVPNYMADNNGFYGVSVLNL